MKNNFKFWGDRVLELGSITWAEMTAVSKFSRHGILKILCNIFAILRNVSYVYGPWSPPAVFSWSLPQNNKNE